MKDIYLPNDDEMVLLEAVYNYGPIAVSGMNAYNLQVTGALYLVFSSKMYQNCKFFLGLVVQKRNIL